MGLRLVLSLLVLLSGTAFAGPAAAPPTAPKTAPNDMKEITPPQTGDSSQLKFHIGLPAWASGISGEMGAKGAVSDVGYISFSNILEKLDYVIPGSLSVDYGKWGVLVEGQYVKLGLDFSAPINGPLPGPRGPTIVVGATVKMEQAFADFNLSYKVIDTDKFTLAPFVGTRFEYVKLSGTFGGTGPLGDVDASGEQTWADPILGVQASYQVFKPVAVVAKADVGGFGAASKLTYQFFIGTQANLTRNLYLSAGYRYLSTDYNSDGFTYNVASQGPQLTFGVYF